MFKNRSIQMKLVNDKKTSKNPETVVNNNIDINSTKLVRNVTIAVGALYVLKSVVDVSSEIALNMTSK